MLELENFSTRGVETPSSLKQAFSDLSGKIVVVSKSSKNSETLTQRILNSAASLIAFRRVDGKADSTSVDAYIVKVENSLRAGNLEGAKLFATNIIRDFPETLKIIHSWISSVNERLLAERAIASLHVYTVALIAQSGK